jgi:hypothetical protein
MAFGQWPTSMNRRLMLNLAADHSSGQELEHSDMKCGAHGEKRCHSSDCRSDICSHSQLAREPVQDCTATPLAASVTRGPLPICTETHTTRFGPTHTDAVPPETRTRPSSEAAADQCVPQFGGSERDPSGPRRSGKITAIDPNSLGVSYRQMEPGRGSCPDLAASKLSR